MTITKESEGRLNAFANEPQIEVINDKPSASSSFKLLMIASSLLLIGLIAFSFTIK